VKTMDDGGPAFPVPMHDDGNGKAIVRQGMTIRDYLAAKAMQSLLSDNEREWLPDFDEVVEDPDGCWMLNPDTKVVYPIPVSYTPSKSHVRVRSINTWRERLVREAYRIADAMLAARKQVRG
jgi:hypothetical protein